MRTHSYSWELSVAEINLQGPILLERVRKRWPAAFGTAKPLKLGIRQDMTAGRLSEQDADVFLTWYCKTPDYLQAHAEGAPRYDLHGQPCGEVSYDNALFAWQELESQRYAAFRRKLLGDVRVRRGGSIYV